MVERAGCMVLGLSIVLTTAGCAESVEPEPWLLPVDASTPTIVLPPAADEARAGRSLELVEEQVIGGSAATPELLFGSQPPQLARADDGRLAVLDGSNRRVVIVGSDGDVEQVVGRRGQGPGEIGQGIEILVSGDVVQVLDTPNRRWNRWRLDGELLDSVRVDVNGSQAVAVGAPAPAVVWRQSFRTLDGFDVAIRRVRIDGELLQEYARMPWPERTIDPPLGEIVDSEPDAWWVGRVPPSHAVSPSGRVYLSMNERYQVHAFESDGAPIWALQRPLSPRPVAQSEIDFYMEQHLRRFPSRTAAHVDWPPHQYALGQLAVDGHGHLYVFPYTPRGGDPRAPRAVDVYSVDGEPLFSGLVAGRLFTTAFATYNGPMLEIGWQAAAGDHVWSVVENSDGDYEIVRYRLVEPF